MTGPLFGSDYLCVCVCISLSLFSAQKYDFNVYEMDGKFGPFQPYLRQHSLQICLVIYF